MRILILGGTGAMGIHLVKILANRGFDIHVTTRSDRPSKGNIHFIQGNAQELPFLQNLLAEDWDAIVDFMIYRTEVFKSRVQLFLKSTKQYVFLSSARVYAQSRTPIKENSGRLLDTCLDEDYLKTDEYALRKARQENVLIESEFTNWTIIRPYITYAENRLQLGVLEKEDWLYRALKGRTIVFNKDMAVKLTTLTYGLDVADGICALIGKNGSYGQSFHITTNQSIKWSDVLSIYLNLLEAHLGYRPKILLQDIDTFLEWRLGKYQVIYDRLYDRTFDNNKISQYIDVNKFQNAENKLSDALATFLKKPQFNEINWRHEALKDRHTSERASLNEIKGLKNKLIYLSCRYFNGLIENGIKNNYRKIKKIVKSN